MRGVIAILVGIILGVAGTLVGLKMWVSIVAAPSQRSEMPEATSQYTESLSAQSLGDFAASLASSKCTTFDIGSKSNGFIVLPDGTIDFEKMAEWAKQYPLDLVALQEAKIIDFRLLNIDKWTGLGEFNVSLHGSDQMPEDVKLLKADKGCLLEYDTSQSTTEVIAVEKAKGGATRWDGLIASLRISDMKYTRGYFAFRKARKLQITEPFSEEYRALYRFDSFKKTWSLIAYDRHVGDTFDSDFVPAGLKTD